jgi:hypothetical protein
MTKHASPGIQVSARPPGEFVSGLSRSLLVLLVFALVLPTGLVAIGEGVGTLKLPYNLHIVDLRLPVIFKLHMLASGLALLLIPLAIGLRRDQSLHRLAGRLAAVSVVAGGLTAFPVALSSDSVAVARAGFLAQGLVWLWLIGAGVRAVRARRIADHARFMVMMAAVASGAIWVRLITAAAVATELPFEIVYGAAAWLGWLVPLAIARALPASHVMRLPAFRAHGATPVSAQSV